MSERSYLCIDLKSFYASVECVERGLDPMTTNLVVADPERSEKTICLAVTPAMKSLGVKNRCRVFEIPKNINYITAPPRMQLYINYAAEIYAVYLEFVSKEDIHVYSVDEAFLDVTEYLAMYKADAKTLGMRIMDAVYRKTGVRAACGVGTNLYLAKIALDITAKHSPDFIGMLDEESYRETLWQHRPLTDFWRIGHGTAGRLEKYSITTMEDIAKADEEFLYRLFGVDAELLIDHAWGREPTAISDIKNYRPRTNSISSGQVLMRDYSFDEGRIIVREMMDLLCLDLVDKELVTDLITLNVGYSNSEKADPAKGSLRLEAGTSSDRILISAAEKIYECIVNKRIPIRRLTLTCCNVVSEDCCQISLFDDIERTEKSRKIQRAVIDVKKRFGKNSILKGMNFEEAATSRERNRQIGGHKSGEQT